jgi:O-antigen/teichoic acid export membrane protein
MVINLIATPILLKTLGEAAYGIQSFVNVIIGYLTVMEMGLDVGIIKFVAEDRATGNTVASNRLLSTTLQLYALIGLLGMLTIIFFADFFAQYVFKVPEELVGQATHVFQLAGIGFFGSIGMTWGRAVTQGMQRFDISYSVLIINQMFGLGLGLGAVYLGYGVVGYVLMRVIILCLSGATFWILAMYLLPGFQLSWGLDRKALSRIKGYVGYGMLNRTLGSLVGKLDQTLIGIWIGVAAAGIYSVPFMISNSFAYMISYMVGFVFPMASEFQSLGQMDRFVDIFIRTSRFVAALANMIFIPLLVIGDIFFVLWLGDDFAGKTADVFRLLVLSSYLGVLSVSLTNNVVVGTGHIREFTIYNCIRATSLGLGCVLLIRPLGIEGAALSVLLSNIVNVIYLVIVLKRYLQISLVFLFRMAYLKPIMLGFVLAGLSYLLRPLAGTWSGFILVGIALEIFFVGVGYLIGIFGETEKRAILGLRHMVFKSHKY